MTKLREKVLWGFLVPGFGYSVLLSAEAFARYRIRQS